MNHFVILLLSAVVATKAQCVPQTACLAQSSDVCCVYNAAACAELKSICQAQNGGGSFPTPGGIFPTPGGIFPTPGGIFPTPGGSSCYSNAIQATFQTCLGGAYTMKTQCKCLKQQAKAYEAIGCTELSTLPQQCSGCFPATSTVELESGKTITMDQLQLGDKVRVGLSEFSEIYFFSTEMADTTSKFVKLVTDSSAVTMTVGHYLYVNGELKVASDVQVGDNVVLGNGTSVAVTAVASVWAPGLYNPHTLHGDIVVDGIHTSTYTDAVHPILAHALMSPLRIMHSAGISFGKDFRDTAESIPSWLRKAIRV